MNINNAGLAIIKQFEGLRLKSYLCPAKKWTVGYGHTGPDVKPGTTIREIEAEQLLKGDLLKFEHGVQKAIGDTPTTQNQFSAMVCLAYNIGIGVPGGKKGLYSSSVLRYHKQGRYTLAANAFLLFVWGGGAKLPGLIRRRNAERKLYVS